MRILDSLRFRMASLFQRSKMHAEIEEELRLHIQHRADDLERSGVARAEAERRARIELAGAKNTRKRSTERRAGISSRAFCRMRATACACCANRPDSQLPPC